MAFRSFKLHIVLYFRYIFVEHQWSNSKPEALVTVCNTWLGDIVIAINEQFAFSRFVARFLKAIQICQSNS